MKKRPFSPAGILSFFLLLSWGRLAAAATLQGTVRDTGGLAGPNAQVFVMTALPGKPQDVQRTQTDAAGAWKVEAPDAPAGKDVPPAGFPGAPRLAGGSGEAPSGQAVE